MPRWLAQQRMTLSDLEWPFHASRAISVVAELLVVLVYSFHYFFGFRVKHLLFEPYLDHEPQTTHFC